MFNITDYFFWLSFIFYYFSVFTAFYIPGSILLHNTNLKKSVFIPVALFIGMVLFAWQTYIFGYIGFRDFTYFYLMCFFIIWLKNHFQKVHHIFNIGRIPSKIRCILYTEIKIDITILLIIVTGVLIQLSTIWFSGIIKDGQANYCCGDPNDNFWFASVTNEIIRNIPPEEPGMKGQKIVNYHYWSNIVSAEISRVFRLPSWSVQYQFQSILISIFSGLLLIGFSELLNLGKIYIRWLLFFFYFGSDTIYWLILIIKRSLIFSMSSLEDGAGFLANMPRALGVAVFLATLCLFINWIRKPSLKVTIILALAFSSLIGIKIYLGIFALIGISAAGFVLYKTRIKNIAVLFIFTILFSLFIFLPVNSGSGGFYYTGLWRFENFVVQPALGMERLEQARVIFAADKKWHRVIPYEILFIILYFIGTFGTKLIGIFQTKASIGKFPKYLNAFFISGMTVSLILGLFFMQSVGSTNTFNFLVIVFIILSFYAALSMTFIISRLPKALSISLSLIVIFATIPRVVYRFIDNLNNYSKPNKSFILKTDYVNAVDFIIKNIPETSLIAVDSDYFNFEVGSPVFSAITNRQSYFSGKNMLKHFQVNTDEYLFRDDINNKIFKNQQPHIVQKALYISGIDYLILPASLIESSNSAEFIKPVYADNSIIIAEVLKGAALQE